MQIRRHTSTRLALASLVLVSCVGNAVSQTDLSRSQGSGCTANKAGACDKSAFLAAFSAAKTLDITTQPADQMASGQLDRMVTSLGRTPALAGTPADLTLALEKVNTDGVFVGPGGTELAILRVYKNAPDGTRGNLIWVESFSGQLDVQWPAAVRSLIQQFQSRVGKH